MRFVPVKNEQQQSFLMLHRIRPADRRADRHDQCDPEAHGGVRDRRGAARAGLKVLLAIVSDPEDERLPPLARKLLVDQAEHLRAIEARIADLDGRLVRQTRDDEACRRLTAAPGVGPVIATAVVATVGDANLFDSGRGFSPTCHRRQGAPARHQQARRWLSAPTADAWCTITGPGGEGRQRPTLGMDQRASRPPAFQRSRGAVLHLAAGAVHL
jgi:transposase